MSTSIDDVVIKHAHEVYSLREDLEFKVDAYLRKCGWKSTTDNPGCYYLWERVIDGRAYTVDQPTALRIQCEVENRTALMEDGSDE